MRRKAVGLLGLLGLLTSLGACRSWLDVPPSFPKVSRFRWRTLDALWYREIKGKPPAHGTTTIRAGVAPNPRKEVRVGVLEQYAGSTGSQWRASVWLASFLASVLLQRELTDKIFVLSTGGFIDGPSAGALMAAGFMAAMTGAKIRQAVTVTGGLAPDASLLPVGGIPEKIRAAKAMGKTVVGIPAGQRLAKSADGKTVDVVALGASLGVEVHLLRDLRETYALLTGRPLPAAPEARVSEMTVGPEIEKGLREQIAAWRTRIASDDKLARDDANPRVTSGLKRARDAARLAEALVTQGNVATAYFTAYQGAVWARAAMRVASLSGEPRLLAAAGSFETTSAAIKKVEKALEALSRDPRASPLALLAAYGVASRARGYRDVAAALLGAAGEQLKLESWSAEGLKTLKKSGKGYLPLIFLSLADLSVDQARVVLGHLSRTRKRSKRLRLRFDRGHLVRVARSLVSAAGGNLEMIDALVLREIAEKKEERLDDIRSAFALKERSYLLAMKLAQSAIKRSEGGDDSVHSSLMRLADAANSYTISGAVLTKHYALESDLAETPDQEKGRRGRALVGLVRMARHNARVAAAAARRRVGSIPFHARLYYQAGLKLMGGRTSWKLRALSNFWRSSLASRVVEMVVRRGK